MLSRMGKSSTDVFYSKIHVPEIKIKPGGVSMQAAVRKKHETTMRMLYNGLREMDAQTHEHIYLENNILFPRVII